MLSHWPIKHKLFICVGLLVVIVGVQAVNGLQGLYAYRELTKTISWRADELPLADELSHSITEVQDSMRSRGLQFGTGGELAISRADVNRKLDNIEVPLSKYQRHLDVELPQFGKLSDRSSDRKALNHISRILTELQKSIGQGEEFLDQGRAPEVTKKLSDMQSQVNALKPHLYERMQSLSAEARGQYQTWIGISWSTGILSSFGLVILLGLFYFWVMAPLNLLIRGSRRIARGDFNYHIRLRTHDEMAELAECMNSMTARFLEIQSDQEMKIQQRTKEVVRSESLAGIGFLAAGVAHEINNPLASIAMCSESLESRVSELLANSAMTSDQAADCEVVFSYLRAIKEEAFRCKGITKRLLDFARIGDVQKQQTNLYELVTSVIEMLGHIAHYRDKKIEFNCPQHVVAQVNAQEMKQVVLNLITNALNSLDPGGTVWVELRQLDTNVELLVRDNGCGMSSKTIQHLFEPFYTRQRDGKGTGLGLAITYRIVTEHGGTIEPTSAGPTQGSQMRVLLPLFVEEKEHDRKREGPAS